MSKDLTVEVEYEVFSTVYIKADTEQIPHTIGSYMICPGNVIMYEVRSMGSGVFCYSEEISKEKAETNHVIGYN
jgi:hypothetical protein